MEAQRRETAHNPPEEPAHRLEHLAERQGATAIPELRAALTHPDPWIRLHAVQGLSTLDEADAHAALAQALHDSSFGVHWAAARALVAVGRPGVIAVLRALVHDQPATGFLHGVASVLSHATLTAAERTAVAPVLEALHHPAADLETSVAAFTALGAFADRPFSPTDIPTPWYETLRRARPRRSENPATATISVRIA